MIDEGVHDLADGDVAVRDARGVADRPRLAYRDGTRRTALEQGHEPATVAAVEDAHDVCIRGQHVGDDSAHPVERGEVLALQVGHHGVGPARHPGGVVDVPVRIEQLDLVRIGREGLVLRGLEGHRQHGVALPLRRWRTRIVLGEWIGEFPDQDRAELVPRVIGVWNRFGALLTGDRGSHGNGQCHGSRNAAERRTRMMFPLSRRPPRLDCGLVARS